MIAFVMSLVLLYVENDLTANFDETRYRALSHAVNSLKAI
jgi:hypothetical protein